MGLASIHASGGPKSNRGSCNEDRCDVGKDGFKQASEKPRYRFRERNGMNKLKPGLGHLRGANRNTNGSKYSLCDLESRYRQAETVGKDTNDTCLKGSQDSEDTWADIGNSKFESELPANTNDDGDAMMVDMVDESELSNLTEYLNENRDMLLRHSGVDNQEETYHSVNNCDYPLNTAISISNNSTYNPLPIPPKETLFVVDTNFIISHLKTLESLRELCGSYHHKILIPVTVIHELDGLKNCNTLVHSDKTRLEEDLAILARRGTSWMYEHFANGNSGLQGQLLKQRWNPSVANDDAILDCCKYFKEKMGKFVILMSNDKNLCLKALVEEILTVSYRKDMSAQLIASMAYRENIFKYNYTSISTDVDLESKTIVDASDGKPSNKQSVAETAHLFQETYQKIVEILLESIDIVMHREYGSDLELISYTRNKLRTITDAIKHIYKNWLAVYSAYFRKSKMKRDDWNELPENLVKAPENAQELQIFIDFWDTIIRQLLEHDSVTYSTTLMKDLNNIIRLSESFRT